jgi:hypothetical protein
MIAGTGRKLSLAAKFGNFSLGMLNKLLQLYLGAGELQ